MKLYTYQSAAFRSKKIVSVGENQTIGKRMLFVFVIPPLARAVGYIRSASSLKFVGLLHFTLNRSHKRPLCFRNCAPFLIKKILSVQDLSLIHI